MASEQCRKPSDQTSHQIQSGYHQKSTTTQTQYHNKNQSGNNEHTLSEKVKEMAHSARKMFNHNEQQGHPAANNHTHKPTSNGPAHDKKEKEKKKKTEGHEHHCMPNMLDHMKKKKKKKSKAGKHTGSGSSSDSD